MTSASFEVPWAESQAWHVPSVGCPAKGSSRTGREDADLIVRIRDARGQHKGGLREVRPAGEPLHLAYRETLAVKHDGNAVARVRRGREDVDLSEGAPHYAECAMPGSPGVAD